LSPPCPHFKFSMPSVPTPGGQVIPLPGGDVERVRRVRYG